MFGKHTTLCLECGLLTVWLYTVNLLVQHHHSHLLRAPMEVVTEWLVPPSPLPSSYNALDSVGLCMAKDIIFDQQGCGACLAFSVATVYGLRACLRGGEAFARHVPSPYRLYDCAGGDCALDRGLNELGAMRVMTQRGVPPLLDSPAVFGQGCPSDKENTTHWLRVQRYRHVCGAQPIKRELMQGGPAVFAMSVSEEALQIEENLRKGQLEHGSIAALTYHSLVVLGWDDQDSTWRVQNSWSHQWGVHGRGTVPRSFFDCVLVFEPALFV